MYKNRKSKLSPLSSSQNISAALSKNAVASTSSIQSIQPLLSVPSSENVPSREDIDSGLPQPKKMKLSDQVLHTQEEDMFAIPSSQLPVEPRYSSQRTIMARTQSILSNQRQPKNYFEKVLIECGVGLETMECYMLTCNHLNLVTKIRDILKHNDNFPNNIKDFVSGVNDAMKTYMTLSKLFAGCKLSLRSSDSIYTSQESLIKDLLMIDFLQKDLIEILFEKIQTFVGDDDTLKLEIPYVDLILSELKYLNIVEHGDIVLFKIFEILELASPNYQQIVIRSMPDIIDVTRHDEAMERLMTLVPKDESLLAFSNVDTFGNMHLNAHILNELRQKIIQHMKYKSTHELFPSFVKFILRINSDEMDALPYLISDLRECLHWNITTENKEEIYANQKEVIDSIVRSLSASKQTYDIWLKTILATALEEDQKSIDFIILLIMIKINEDKTFYIEQLIRKKIKSKQFTISILEKLVEEFISILTEYVAAFIYILDKCFRDKNEMIVAFAAHGFTTLFNIDQFDKKILMSKLVGYVCQTQVGCDKTTGFDVATNALRILSDFNEKNPAQMQKHGLQLLRMLDRASELTLTQYRMIMNILCSIAYPLPPMTGAPELQNHIDMLLKKQVASSIPTIKNLGIVGVVQTIEHLIWTNETNEAIEWNETIETIDDIVDTTAKTAAIYLDLVLSATRSSPESLGLCFDELAAVLSHRNKNHRKNLTVCRSFAIWFSDFIVGVFQDLFIVDTDPNTDLECGYQYALNSSEDNNTESEVVENIAVNIAGLTFKSSSNPLGSVLLLPSFFNLVRITQFYRYGNLISINALLGCAIVLPKCINSSSEMNIYEDYNEARANKFLDIYYLTVNWMRETISAFVSQNDKKMQKKTMIRLNEVIQLEDKIRSLLQIAPSNYVPPICQFNCSPNKQTKQIKAVGAQSKASKKKAPAAAEVNFESQNNTLFELLHTQRSVANRFNANVKINFNSISYGPKEIYRQMDPDIARLLNQKLLIKYPLQPENVGEVLGLVEFKFLMDDLVIKMESIFGVKKFVADQPLQYVVSPSDLVNDLIKFLPQIVQFFIQLTDHLRGFLRNKQIDSNSELYSDELNYTKINIGLCLRLFAACFTWSNFQLEVNEHLLRESLAALAQENESEMEVPICQLSKMAMENIVRHSATIWDLQSALHMLHLLRALAMYSKSNKIVVDLCKEFLSRKWYDFNGMPERGGKCNVLLDDLLKGRMKSATFFEIKDIVKTTSNDIKALSTKTDFMKSFPNFNKANVALLYRSLCSALIVAVNAELGKSAPTSVQIKVFYKSTVLLQSLADVVGLLNIPRNYGIFLKHAHIYMKIFLHHGIPLIQNGLRSNSEQILEFLKKFNHISAFLHKICCHWKANQNAAIMAQVPFVRETIETLLIKVKAVLAANNCAAAFWQNNLKNKNLHNEEILTQATETDDDENDEEFPEDDDSLEEDCLAFEQDGSRETSVETTKRLSKCNSDTSSSI